MYYSRNGLNFSHQGIFTDKENIYVFSMATETKNTIVIDQYSDKNNSYIQSFKLKYKGFSTNEIQYIIAKKHNIILKFNDNYASFKY